MLFPRFKTLILFPLLSTVSAFISRNVIPVSKYKDHFLAFDCEANIAKKECYVKMDKRKSKLFAMIGFEDHNTMVMAMNTFESISGANVAFITLIYSSAVYLTVKQNMKDESISKIDIEIEKTKEDVIEKLDEVFDISTAEVIKENIVDTTKTILEEKQAATIDILNAKKKVASTAQGEKEKNRLLKKNEEAGEHIETEDFVQDGDINKEEENASVEEAIGKTKKKSFREKLKKLAKKAIAPWKKTE